MFRLEIVFSHRHLFILMHVKIYLLFNFFLYCICSIRRFFCNYLPLTIVSAILKNIVESKSIAVFPLIPMPAYFFNILTKQIPAVKVCGTPLMIFICLRSDYFPPQTLLYRLNQPCVCFLCSRTSQFLQGMRNIVKHLFEISGTCII